MNSIKSNDVDEINGLVTRYVKDKGDRGYEIAMAISYYSGSVRYYYDQMNDFVKYYLENQ